MAEHRAGWLDPLFIGLSVIGFAGLVWILLAPVLAVVAKQAILPTAALTAACVWGSDLAALAVKLASDRSRPFEELEGVEALVGGTVAGSFPSGHAATSFAGAVVLGYLFRRGLAAFLVLAVAVAWSRVYVGVHYPSDILVGAALGTAVALAAVSAIRLRRPTSAAPPRSEVAPPGG